VKQATDGTQLAHAMIFMAEAPACTNAAFNVTNGDVFRWSRLWPRLADFFGVPLGQVRPIKLADWMADKEPVWSRIVEKHGLKRQKLADVANWQFADFQWSQDYDVIANVNKLRLAGFHALVDTEDMFLNHLARYRAEKFLP
jgi:hypothetical protein